MNAFVATLLNGLVLLAMSLWAWLDTGSTSALIPGGFGVAFLLASPGVKAENKIVAHLVVLLAVLIIFALINPLLGTIERGNAVGTIRVGLMILTSVVALVFYVKSFIDARRARASG